MKRNGKGDKKPLFPPKHFCRRTIPLLQYYAKMPDCATKPEHFPSHSGSAARFFIFHDAAELLF
jgi:hypothetical protein